MHKGLTHSLKSLTPRAERFPIKLAVRYRESNKFEWLDGQSENISGTGILVNASSVVFPNTPLEVTFAMPYGRNGDGGANVICQGRAVRTLVPPISDKTPRIGVRILKYHMSRSR